MSNRWINRLLGLREEELSSRAGRETAGPLRLPTLDERISLYSRAVREQHDSGDEAYSNVRDRILNAMAADIAIKAGITLPKEPEQPGLPQDANPDEIGWRPDLLEYRLPNASVIARSLPNEPFVLNTPFEHSADFQPDKSVSAGPTTAALAHALDIEPKRSPRKIERRKRPTLKLAMLAASLCAVAVIGGSITLSLLRETGSPIEWSGEKSDKFDVAVQSSQKLSKAAPEAVVRNKHNTAEAVTSPGAPGVISLANPPSQTAVAALNAPTLTNPPTSNPLTSEQITQLAAKPPITRLGPSLTNQLTPEGIADLVKRGRELILAGKIRDARLLLKRAADAGDTSAAFALGTTYDPTELEKLGARDADPDIAVARAWYQKAKDLGSAAAGAIPQNSDR